MGCPSHPPRRSLPAGMTVETAEAHPRFKHLLESDAGCELDAGHDGVHRAGQLTWHDPPLLLVGGEPYEPGADEFELGAA